MSPGRFALTLDPGDCRIAVDDSAACWKWKIGASRGAFEAAPPNHVVTADLGRNDTATVVAERDAEHLRRLASVEFPSGEITIAFAWFSRQPQPPLTREQAECVKVLLRAFADGTPEMKDEDIVAAAGISMRTFADVFGLALRATGDRWNALLIEGKAPNTWRLTAPPAGMVPFGDEGAPATTPDTSALDRLVELAREELEQVRRLHAAATVPASQLYEAELNLVEAEIGRAEALRDKPRLRDQFDRAIELRTQLLEIVKQQHESGVVPPSAVRDAERELIKLQLRRQESGAGDSPSAARGDVRPPAARLVNLPREQFIDLAYAVESSALESSYKGLQKVIDAHAAQLSWVLWTKPRLVPSYAFHAEVFDREGGRAVDYVPLHWKGEQRFGQDVEVATLDFEWLAHRLGPGTPQRMRTTCSRPRCRHSGPRASCRTASSGTLPASVHSTRSSKQSTIRSGSPSAGR